MNPRRAIVAALLPGVVVAAVAVGGWVPRLRDLASYFVPLRERTAAVLRGQSDPFWTTDVGCGEPVFANPQSDLLYPPGWFGLVLPGGRAVGVEVGVHLGVLAAGCAVLALALGAPPAAALAAALGAAAAGPVLDSAGVLNNLDTLAWLPWLWWAAVRRRGPAVAVFTALAFLGAEPQLAAIGVAIALSLAPSRRSVAAVALGGGLVAALALPFLAWVMAGDRGPGWLGGVPGAVRPAELPGLLFPGLSLAARPDRFVADLAIPVWALVLGAVAVRSGRGAARRLALWSGALAVAAVIPASGVGARLWDLATLGLVRYPGRLLFIAVVALTPAAAAAVAGAVRRTVGAAAVAGTLLVAGVLLGAGPAGVAGQALGAGLALALPASAAGPLLGSLALAATNVGVLAIAPVSRPAPAPCLDAERQGARVYVVAPSQRQFAWVAIDPIGRGSAVGLGYLALGDGRRMARSFAPLQTRATALHLEAADQGPPGRWWLDALGADRFVALAPVPGLPVVCAQNGLVVMDNPEAWPLTFVAAALPRVGEPYRAAGAVDAVQDEASHRIWKVTVGTGGGVLVRLESPDPGWMWRVDGRRVPVVRGPGIVHGVAVPAGEHVVEAQYRPPGLTAGVAISAVAILILLGWAWRH